MSLNNVEMMTVFFIYNLQLLFFLTFSIAQRIHVRLCVVPRVILNSKFQSEYEKIVIVKINENYCSPLHRKCHKNDFCPLRLLNEALSGHAE